MKARPPMARVSGHALRGATRKRLVLRWPRAAKHAPRAVAGIVHRHRHVHAWQVNVQLVRGEDVVAPAAGTVGAAHRAADVAPVRKGDTPRDTRRVPAATRELRTTVVSSLRRVQHTRIEQYTFETHAAPPVRAPMFLPRHPMATIASPGRKRPMSAAIVPQERRRAPAPTAFASPAHAVPPALPSMPHVPARSRSPARELAWAEPRTLHAVRDARESVDTRWTSTAPVATLRAASQTPSPSLAPAGIATAVAAQVREATAAAWSEPDGAALDRLAREVMRRVEKGMRIERERRGR